MSRARLVTFGLLATVACEERLPPQGQVVLYLDTDAPLSEPTPLFDRVLIELFEPGESTPCPDCRREVVVDAQKMKERTFSFGFVPRPRVVGYRARLVLYRSSSGLGPRVGSSIELVGYLPAVAEDGIKAMTARFRTEDVGTARGTLAAPILFDRGAPVSSAVGTWSGARTVDCEGEPPEGSSCVSGGAFFMGDPRVTVAHDSVAGLREHLVVLPPFFLDRKEVSVAAMRASELARLDSRGRSLDPVDDLGDALAGTCDFSSDPGPNEALPVTCVSWALAHSYCQAKGGDLPTEAQLEIVGGLRGKSLTPWGNREPGCDEAVTALARGSSCTEAGSLDLGTRILPRPAGSGTRDRVAAGDEEILDLGANVAEWTRDVFQADDGSCWSASLLSSPVCEAAAPGDDRRSVKGADFLERPTSFMQARRAFSPDASHPEVGFRCAYPAAP